MVAPVRCCWRSRPAMSVRSSKAAAGRWGEVCGVKGIHKDDGVAVVRAWQAWTGAPCSTVAHGVVVAAGAFG